jgi:hypothetical protein
MYTGFHVTCPLFLSDLIKLEFSRQIFEKYSNIKFHKNSSSGRRVVPCRTDRRTDMTMLIVDFRNFANTLKNSWMITNKTLKTGALLVCLSTFHTSRQLIYPYLSNECTLDSDFRFSTSHKHIYCIPAVNKCLLFLSDFKIALYISTTASTIRRYRISYRSFRWQCRRSETTDRRDEARSRFS